jgi:hypothetical protein
MGQIVNLKDYFNLIANIHRDIKHFGSGDIWELAIAGETVYPELWLEQVFNITTDRGRNEYRVAFIIHEKQKHSEEEPNINSRDEIQILDRMFEIGQEVIQKIRNDGLYIVNNVSSCVSLTEFTEDSTVGWRYEITLTQALNINRCDIDGAFYSECTYTNVFFEQNGIFQKITTDTGDLNLSSLPIDLTDTVNLPANVAALDAELRTLFPHVAAEDISAPTVGRIRVSFFSDRNEFLCLVGSISNRMFFASCNCESIATFRQSVNGDSLTGIKIDGVIRTDFSPLPISLLDAPATIQTNLDTLNTSLLAEGCNLVFTFTGVSPAIELVGLADPTDKLYQNLQGSAVMTLFSLQNCD